VSGQVPVPRDSATFLEPGQSFPSRATSVRWLMMGMVTATTILTYLDRLNLSIAGKYIQDEFSIPLKTMGWIFSAFLLGYALSQIPGGYLADRYGPRKVLVIAISWWSILTAGTAVAPRLPLGRWFGLAWSFAIVRFLIGIGEAPSSPCYTKIVANWMGHAHRGLGSSFNLLGIGLGGALTPVLITFIMQHWGWRASFYCCGLVGILVALAWYFLATDRPDQHPRVNQAEVELIGRNRSNDVQFASQGHVPWGRIFTNRSVIALIAGYVLPGTESADHPAEEMPEPHDHGKNLIGAVRIELFAKSFILRVYEVLADVGMGCHAHLIWPSAFFFRACLKVASYGFFNVGGIDSELFYFSGIGDVQEHSYRMLSLSAAKRPGIFFLHVTPFLFSKQFPQIRAAPSARVVRASSFVMGLGQRWESNSTFTVSVSLDAAGTYLHCFIAFMAD
jgi:MFS family permease